MAQPETVRRRAAAVRPSRHRVDFAPGANGRPFLRLREPEFLGDRGGLGARATRGPPARDRVGAIPPGGGQAAGVRGPSAGDAFYCGRGAAAGDRPKGRSRIPCYRRLGARPLRVPEMRGEGEPFVSVSRFGGGGPLRGLSAPGRGFPFPRRREDVARPPGGKDRGTGSAPDSSSDCRGITICYPWICRVLPWQTTPEFGQELTIE